MHMDVLFYMCNDLRCYGNISFCALNACCKRSNRPKIYSANSMIWLITTVCISELVAAVWLPILGKINPFTIHTHTHTQIDGNIDPHILHYSRKPFVSHILFAVAHTHTHHRHIMWNTNFHLCVCVIYRNWNRIVK